MQHFYHTRCKYRFIVGKVGDPTFRRRSFRTQLQAARYIETLPGYQSGCYYLDDMEMK
jgi:hypothetical protein